MTSMSHSYWGETEESKAILILNHAVASISASKAFVFSSGRVNHRAGQSRHGSPPERVQPSRVLVTYNVVESSSSESSDNDLDETGSSVHHHAPSAHATRAVHALQPPSDSMYSPSPKSCPPTDGKPPTHSCLSQRPPLPQPQSYGMLSFPTAAPQPSFSDLLDKFVMKEEVGPIIRTRNYVQTDGKGRSRSTSMEKPGPSHTSSSYANLEDSYARKGSNSTAVSRQGSQDKDGLSHAEQLELVKDATGHMDDCNGDGIAGARIQRSLHMCQSVDGITLNRCRDIAPPRHLSKSSSVAALPPLARMPHAGGLPPPARPHRVSFAEPSQPPRDELSRATSGLFGGEAGSGPAFRRPSRDASPSRSGAPPVPRPLAPCEIIAAAVACLASGQQPAEEPRNPQMPASLRDCSPARVPSYSGVGGSISASFDAPMGAPRPPHAPRPLGVSFDSTPLREMLYERPVGGSTQVHHSPASRMSRDASPSSNYGQAGRMSRDASPSSNYGQAGRMSRDASPSSNYGQAGRMSRDASPSSNYGQAGRMSRDASPSSNRAGGKPQLSPQQSQPQPLNGRCSRDPSPGHQQGTASLRTSRDASPQSRGLCGLADSPPPVPAQPADPRPNWRARLQQPPRAPSRLLIQQSEERAAAERLGPDIPQLSKAMLYIRPDEHFDLVHDRGA